MTINELLEEFRKKITVNRDLGTIFERLIKSYFEHDPLYIDQFKTVWLWSNWPHKWGPDCGIDIVAEDRNGDFTAIQCKFFSADHLIRKEDIDSFFTESGKTFKVDGKKKSFTQRVIVSTSDKWSEPAERSLQEQTIEVQRIRVQDLESSPIDWNKFSLEKPEKLVLREKKKPRDHQKEAITKIVEGFKTSDRGKLIMACGTGKTFTSLRLAEKVTGNKGTVLFLVPSISLLSQTLREWTAEAEKPFHALAVCSDTSVGKDKEDISKHDLAIPATTDAPALIAAFNMAKGDKGLTVIFSTYQSIKVLSDAQKKGLPEFDLIICDEAHRTTGYTLAGEDESHFVKVHDQKFIKAKHRLYMTATPRIYGDEVKAKASEAQAELCSMDDDNYGPEFYRLGFGEAVAKGLLADYKVLVLAVDEKHVVQTFQKKMTNEDGELPFDDLVKIIGCWNGLSKRFIGEEAKTEDSHPMKRAVAFARRIKDSKNIVNVFEKVVSEYISKSGDSEAILNCELKHVDGTFNVLDRNASLDWLKEEAPENTCRILSNARCLSEGVDVPALDAVLFLNPRDSMVDVVQSVGRIMRQAPGKKYGYVILPIGIPAGVPPEEALKDNKKYKVVWQVLQALRAHDDRFNATINQIELNKKRPSQIQVIGVGGAGDETDGQGKGQGKGQESTKPTQFSLNLPEIEEWKDAIYAKIVLKCGTRPYWEQWAADVAKIAEEHIRDITALLISKNSKPRKAFEQFLEGMRKNINPSISEEEAIEMLSQHLITRPIFDALFEHYAFTEMNPVSKAMQGVFDELESNSLRQDTTKLKTFYDSVRMRVKGIDNPEGRQRIIVELYDKFFKLAFPKMADRLGIVYTPVEVVDFIIRSVESVMKKEFQQSLSDEGVHILDPFTGTGTFIVRLLQTGLISKNDFARKYGSELHANEIVLLAYYIATINIEEAYHGMTGNDYAPFKGAVLTDTFQLNEENNQVQMETVLPENSERIKSQKAMPIKVIIGNPPYSVGQKSANDNAANQSYPNLNEKIATSYQAFTSGPGRRALYDTYIKAIRWSTDRLGDSGGVLAFVTNSSWLDGIATAGFRIAIEREFTSIYVINLRGSIRGKSGIAAKKEGQNVFNIMAGVCITLLVKNPHLESRKASIHYAEIGDFLSRDEKLRLLAEYESIDSKKLVFKSLNPNIQGDWLSERSDVFEKFIPLGIKDIKSGDRRTFFEPLFSYGLISARDTWVWNFSATTLSENIVKTIGFYSSELKRFQKAKKANPNLKAKDIVDYDPQKISWDNRRLIGGIDGNKTIEYDSNNIRFGMFRMFCKQRVYFSLSLSHSLYLQRNFFPRPESENLIICISSSNSDGMAISISNQIVDYHYNGDTQCFPLYFYDIENSSQKDLLSEDSVNVYRRKDGISDFVLKNAQTLYGDSVKKEDVFYYVYGFLHNKKYRETFVDDLKKMLPRLPLTEDPSDFWSISKIGRELAAWHLNYETVEPYALKEVLADSASGKNDLYKVIEMSFAKKGKETDKSTIIFNQHLRLSGIPLDAYDYVINGKSAIEWVMERYTVKIDKDSGIKNDPNEWSDDPRYIVDLVKRVVRVSLETNRLVSELPPLEII